MARAFRVGERIIVAPSCPIETEGVVPGAGDRGQLVAPPIGDDARRCWMVRFDRHPLPWPIPERYLEPSDRAG